MSANCVLQDFGSIVRMRMESCHHGRPRWSIFDGLVMNDDEAGFGGGGVKTSSF